MRLSVCKGFGRKPVRRVGGWELSELHRRGFIIPNGIHRQWLKKMTFCFTTFIFAEQVIHCDLHRKFIHIRLAFWRLTVYPDTAHATYLLIHPPIYERTDTHIHT